MESRAKLQAALMMLGNNTSPAAGASEVPLCGVAAALQLHRDLSQPHLLD